MFLLSFFVCGCTFSRTFASMMSNVKKNSLYAWFLAARPKTLAAAAMPVCAASALASAHGSFRLVPAVLCIVFALLMQVAANFIKDRKSVV